MGLMEKIVAKLTTSKSEPENPTVSSGVMVVVAKGILDVEMMDGLAREFNAHRGSGIHRLGNIVFKTPYDKLKGLSMRSYFVASSVAEEFRLRARIAENAGQPLEREIVAVSPDIDQKALENVGKHFGVTVLDLKPNEKLFKDHTLCSVPRNVADQFKQEIAVQGQFSLELVN